jgi:hypothetical protein
MTAAPTQSALTLNALSYPAVQNVDFDFGTGGTGKAILITGATGGANIQDVYIKAPGYGIQLATETGAENFFKWVSIQDAGTIGFLGPYIWTMYELPTLPAEQEINRLSLHRARSIPSCLFS